MDMDAKHVYIQCEKHPDFGPSIQHISPSLNEQNRCFHLLFSSTFLAKNSVSEPYAGIFEVVREQCAIAMTWYSAVPLWPF